jgi:hypothetical protein
MTNRKSAPDPSRPRPPVRRGPAAARQPGLPSDTPTSRAELTPRSVRTPATLDGVGATVRRTSPRAHTRRSVLRAWAPGVGAGLLAAAVTLALGALAVRTFLPSGGQATKDATSSAAVERAAGSQSPESTLPATAAASGARPSGSAATAASASALPTTTASATASAASSQESGRRRFGSPPTPSARGRATSPAQGTGTGADYLPGVL